MADIVGFLLFLALLLMPPIVVGNFVSVLVMGAPGHTLIVLTFGILGGLPISLFLIYEIFSRGQNRKGPRR